MWMFHFTEAIKNRLSFFFLTKANATADALIGENKIIVDSTSPFTAQSVIRSLDKVIIWDDTTTGKLIQGGYEGAQILTIKYISGTKLYFEETINKNFLLSNNPVVLRAPGGSRLNSIILGDVRVKARYPCIAVVPTNVAPTWTTLSGTTDKISIDFIVYVKDDDTEDATGMLLKITDALEWVLRSNLHIAPTNAVYTFERTSKAYVTNIRYGTIEKGSEFLKAASITWEADAYTWQSFITAQGSSPTELPGHLGNYLLEP
jgi:hypothetical protein